MKDKKAIRRARRRIAPIIEKWYNPLGLGWWTTNFDYVSDREYFKRDGDGEALFIVHPRWEYMRALVEVNSRYVLEVTDEFLEFGLLHEFAHILIDEISHDEDAKHVERVATTIAHSFMWLRDYLAREQKEC